jgi:single-strand DNA-binding protein
MSTITIVGNLGNEPELRFTPTGVAVAKFSVGVNRRIRDDAGNWTDGPTSWHDVAAWQHLAEHVAESLQKGTRVIVTGNLEQRSWDDPDNPGKKKYAWQITAQNVGVDLTFGTATFQKSVKSGAPADPNDPWATASRTRPEPAPAPAGAGAGYSQEPPF